MSKFQNLFDFPFYNKIKVTLNIDNIVDITTLQNEINIQLQSNYNNLPLLFSVG